MTDYKVLPPPLVTHAGLRGGVFTNSDATRFGLRGFTAALRSGECFRVHPGLYSLHPELDVAGRIWAGLKLGGPAATLGLGAAAWVRGQGPEPDVIDVWCGRRNLKDRGPWRFHSGEPDEVQSCEAVDEAFGRFLLSPTADAGLARKLAGRALRLRDRERFLELCTAPRAEGRSAFETALNRDVLLAHGLPLLEWAPLPDGTQHSVRAALFGVDVNLHFDGSLTGRNLRPSYGWMGRPHHDDPEEPQLFGWPDVLETPCLVAGKIARRLRARAWQGEVLDCRNCTMSPSAFSMMREEDGRSLTECPTCGSQLVQLWRMPEHREAALR